MISFIPSVELLISAWRISSAGYIYMGSTSIGTFRFSGTVKMRTSFKMMNKADLANIALTPSRMSSLNLDESS